MAVRTPVFWNGTDIQAMSTSDIDGIKAEVIRQYAANPSVTLSITDNANELITNGDFVDTVPSAPVGWTAYNGATIINNFTLSNEILQVTNAGGLEGGAYQSFTTVNGGTYFVVVDIPESLTATSGSNRVYVGTSAGDNTHLSQTGVASGFNVFEFTATGTTTFITLLTGSTVAGELAYFDSVSVTIKDGNMGTLIDTRLQAGRALSSDGTTPLGFQPETTTPEPVVREFHRNVLKDNTESLSAPTDTSNRRFPLYLDASNNLQAMSLTDMFDTFIDPAITTLTTAATTSSQAGTYRIATVGQLDDHTIVSSMVLFYDTRADTTLYTAAGIAEVWDQPETITNYYVFRIETTQDGTELISNGTFDTTTTGWTAYNGATLTSETGYLRITNDGTGTNAGGAYQTITTTIGANYRIRLQTFNGITGTPPLIKVGTSIGDSTNLSDSGTNVAEKWEEFDFTATATTTYINLEIGVTTASVWCRIDNVSVKQKTETLPTYETPLYWNGTDIQEFSIATFQSDLQELVRYYATQTGSKITYGLGTSSTGARGSAIVDTRLNGTGNYQTLNAGLDDYRAQEFPDGTATTITTYYLTCTKT